MQLVPQVAELTLPYWDGTRKKKQVTSWFFSDMQTTGDGRVRRGKVSAEVVALLVLHIRKDIVENIGWAPTTDDLDDD